MQYLIVFLGGGLGTLGRHGVNMLAARLVGTAYPFGTFAINVLGSFAMGLVTGLLATRLDLSPSVRLFLTTGILGGFTTFSAFSLETALLIERGEHGAAAIYVLASVLVAIPALFAGLTVARSMGGA
jgi:CrcB protein